MADHQTLGSVTPLASIFPAEEAHKAAKRVQEAISEHEKELHRLSHYSTENKNLINLVQRLPDELSHEIMVPFGKAAFFPGRLIHTNEFMVLLGEGYYVERTSKQTVEILHRRGKTIDSQTESLKAMMMDLDTEAKFFSATAAEAEEGLVEIREDYVEGILDENKVESGNADVSDEEYARIMSRLDELEDEEKAAEDAVPDQADGPSLEVQQLMDLPHGTEARGVAEKQQPKAFTGSVVERHQGLSPSVAPPEASLTSSSKRVSRFKMQRCGR